MKLCTDGREITLLSFILLGNKVPAGTKLLIRSWAVVVAQLVEQLLPTPEDRGSSPVIGYSIYIVHFLSTALKGQK